MQAVMGMPSHKAYCMDMPRALRKDKLNQLYNGLKMIKNGIAYYRELHILDVDKVSNLLIKITLVCTIGFL